MTMQIALVANISALQTYKYYILQWSYLFIIPVVLPETSHSTNGIVLNKATVSKFYRDTVEHLRLRLQICLDVTTVSICPNFRLIVYFI